MKRNISRHLLITMVAGVFLLGASCISQPTDEPNADQNQTDGLSATEVLDQAKNNKNKLTEEKMTDKDNVVERPPVPTAPVGVLPDDRIKGKRIRLNTSKGQVVFNLFPDEAPKTVSNFIALAESGYFDGLTFHRVVPGFVIQGGDPKGTGTGGPGYKFEDEPVMRDYKAGTVAMANSGPNTNGSQFFICLEDQPGLPKDYTIFGQVISGMEAVGAITVGDTMNEVLIETLQ